MFRERTAKEALPLQIKALDEDGDVRALGSDGKPVKPASVQTYLERAFKSRLADAERALKASSALPKWPLDPTPARACLQKRDMSQSPALALRAWFSLIGTGLGYLVELHRLLVVLRAVPCLQDLASSYADPDDLAKHAYDLYSEFRPQIAQGQAGWGKPGLLDLQQIKELHKKD